MTAKHIVHISSYYPPHLGGQENAVHSLANQLAAAGHHVQVITSTKGSNQKGTKIEGKVRVQRLRSIVFGHAPIMPWLPVALFRAANTHSVVHIHIGQAFTPEIVWLLSKLRRFTYIAQLHIDFEPSGPAGILLPLYKRLVLKRVLRSAGAVVTLNQKTAHLVRTAYGYTGKICVMNNGIDEAYFALTRPPAAPQPPATLRLVFVGRLSKQKNIIALLQALRLTKRRVHVDILGDGAERDTIKKTIAAYGLSNVTLHGRLDRAQVTQFYATCDALILPSLYEAQPLVLLEAMAARIPIIGTNVIGVADHIRDVGIIAKPTAQGLAEGIEHYYARYSSLPNMVQKGRDIAEQLRWPHTLRKYETLYEQTVEN